MEHPEAQQMGAVERYALGDLSVSEVEEFERHFFDCPQCSEELRLLSVLQDNARAVFIEAANEPISGPVLSEPVSEQRPTPTEAPKRSSWWSNWGFAMPAFAMLAAAVFLGYQAGARKTSEPQPVGAYPLYSASRGAETVVSPAAGAQFYTLYMDRTWDRDFDSYRAVVRDDAPKSAANTAQGSERVSMPLPAPAAGHAIYVLLPARALPAGRYVLTILGKDSSGRETAAAEYTFTLRIQ